MLIDLDNTLVDRDEALRRYLRARGYDELVGLIGPRHVGMWTLARMLLARYELPESTPSQLARRIRAELPATMPRTPAVRARLESLATEGYRLALVSNGGGRTQRAKLEAAGLDVELFDAICISEERRVAKPDPGLFELALEEIGVEPGSAMMIGDSPEHDVLGARGVGVRSCWLARGREYPAQMPRPDWVTEDFAAACERVLAAR